MNMMTSLKSAVSALALLVAWPLVAAELPVPTDAKAVDQHAATELERVYPLGALRKISGQLRMENKIEGRGQLSSVTWQLPVERTASEAFTQAREALQAEGGYALFWCEARDCGESNLWANEVFGNARLYGSDEQQAFVLLRLAAPAQDTLIALYGITRGNKRAYLHAEQFVANAPLADVLPTPATVLRELRSTGKLDYPDLEGEPPADWVVLLGRSFNLDSTLRVTLAGAQAEAWREQLIKTGVRAARLEVGQGSASGLHVELIR